MRLPASCLSSAFRAGLLLSLAAFGPGSSAARADETPARPSLADLRLLPSPAAPGSAEPHLAVSKEGRVWFSWIEKRTTGGSVLRVARLDGRAWSKPLTVVAGDSLIASWADFPIVLPLGGDRLAVYFPWKTGDAGAHEVRTTQSVDGGRSWGPAVTTHRDGTPTEH